MVDECDVIRDDVDEDEDKDEEDEPRAGLSIGVSRDSTHDTCSDCGREYKRKEQRITWRVDIPPCEGTGDWEIEWEDSCCMKCFKKGSGKRFRDALVEGD